MPVVAQSTTQTPIIDRERFFGDPEIAGAQISPSEPPPPTESIDNTMNNLTTRLKAFDTRLEEMREKLRIPGLALVIVKDASIVYLKGKGYRNLEERLPATEDTLFAIGSTSNPGPDGDRRGQARPGRLA